MNTQERGRIRMRKITFKKAIRRAEFLSPPDFKTTAHSIEFRKDPLTDRWCRMNMERTRRVKQARTIDFAESTRRIENSKQKCFFCPENLERTTPKFPSYFPAERMKGGSACLFPNLFPFGEFHAVGVFSEKHYLSLNEFSAQLLKDCFNVCLEYFNFIRNKHPDIKYCTINWNYMPPAAASIIHPHVQILTDRGPTFQVKELIETSKRYCKRNGGNYWLNLIETEKQNYDRWIGEAGSVAWLTSFAPQGNREVLAIFSRRVSTLIRLSESDLNDFCEGLSRILRGYHEMGVKSFNMTTFSGPNDQDISEYYLLNAKLISRPDFEPFYTNDDGFMEKFHYEPVVETSPEDVAKRMREYF